MELREGLGKKLKPFSTNKKQGLQRLCMYLGGVRSGLLGFNTAPFSLTLLNFEEYRGRIRNRIKFWIERLIIDLPREFGFRGTWF